MIITKLKEIFSKINIIIEFILSIFLASNILDVLYAYKYNGEVKIVGIALIIILSILIISIIIYNIIKNKEKLEIYFLIFMIPIGMMYQIFLIPNYVPDELAHIYRAYDISQGNIITKIDEEGDSMIKLPSAFTTNLYMEHDSYKDVETAINSKTDYKDKVLTYTSAQSYSPILYAFSSMGFLIGRILNINVIYAVYLARIFNFIVFLLVGYYIIKLMPFGKLLMLVYLFNPMLIHQAVSISGDSITNSSILLFIAYTLNILYNENPISKKTKVLYILLAIAMSISKNVYFPIVGLALLLFSRKKLSRKKRQNFYSVNCCVRMYKCGSLVFIWNFI